MAAKAKHEDEPVPPELLIGRARLEFEQATTALRVAHERRFEALEARARRFGDELEELKQSSRQLQADFQVTRERFSALERECQHAVRESVKQASQAREAAQVYERMKDLQPATDDKIRKLQTQGGRLVDALAEHDRMTQQLRIDLDRLLNASVVNVLTPPRLAEIDRRESRG
jgi:predicted  nucleic acid-binding Zn-ribbon protein